MKISKKILKFLLYVFLIVNYNSTNATSSVYTDDLEKSIDLYSNEEYELSISILDDLIKSGGLDDVLLTRSFFCHIPNPRSMSTSTVSPSMTRITFAL